MYLTLIASAISAVAGFGLAWQLQAGNLTKLELTHANERISMQRATRSALERNTGAVISAQNAAAARVAVIRRDSDAARAGLVGLRDATDAAMRAASASIDACTNATATAHQLLNQCGAEYQSLAQIADGHVSDIKTLTSAWPK